MLKVARLMLLCTQQAFVAFILVFVAQAIACDFMCGRRGVAADSE